MHNRPIVFLVSITAKGTTLTLPGAYQLSYLAKVHLNPSKVRRGTSSPPLHDPPFSLHYVTYRFVCQPHMDHPAGDVSQRVNQPVHDFNKKLNKIFQSQTLVQTCGFTL